MADLTLAVRLVGDGTSLSGTVKLAETDLRRLDKTVDDVGRTARNTQGATEQMGRGLSALRSHMLGLIGIWGAGQARDFVAGLASASLSIERVNRALSATAGARAGAEYEFVRQTALRLGLDLATTADAFTKLSASAMGTRLAGEQTQQIFTAVAQAAATLGLSAAETEGALTAIGQMMSKGTVSAEELRGQLGERLPGAFQVAARAMGVTTAELGKMLEQGQILADDFLPRFAREMQRAFGGEVPREVRTAAAEFARMKTAVLELQAALGDRLVPSLAGGSQAVANIARAMREAANESGVLASLWVGLGGAAAETWRALFGGEQEQSARQLKDQIAGLKDALAGTERQIRSIEASPFYLGDKWKQIAGLQSKAYDLRDALREAQTALNALQRTGPDSPLEPQATVQASASASEWAQIKNGLLTQEEKYLAKRAETIAAAHAAGASEEDLADALSRVDVELRKQAHTAAAASGAKRTSAQASDSAAQAERQHREEVERTIQQLTLEQTELTQGARARYEAELVARKFTATEREQALSIYDSNEALKAKKESDEEAARSSQKLAEEVDVTGQVIERAAERMTDAFSDFFSDLLTRGVKSFKDFGQTINGLFTSLLGDLAAAAMRNQIKIWLGMAAGGAPASAGAGMVSALGAGGGTGGTGGSGVLSALGTGGSLLSGMGTVLGIGGAGMGVGWGLSTSAALVGNLGYFGAFAPAMSAAGGALAAGQVGLAASLAAPYLLPAIAGGVILSQVFKKKKRPPRATLASGSGVDFEDDVSVATPLGGLLGLRAQDTSRVDAGDFEQALQGVAQLDTLIAGVMGEDELRRVRAAMEGWASRTDQRANEFQDLVAERIDAIIRASDLPEALRSVVQVVGEEAETTAQRFVAVRQMQAFTESLIELQPVAASLTESLDLQAQAMREVIASYDGSLEAQQRLAQASQARYEAELQYLAELRAVSERLSGSFGSFDQIYEQIMLAGLTPQQGYDYYRGQVDWLVGQLAEATSPEVIEDLVGRILGYTQTAFGALGEGQAARVPEYLNFLNQLEALAQGSLGASEQSLRDSGADLRDQVGQAMTVAVDRLAETADSMAAATAELAAAAQALRETTGILGYANYGQGQVPVYG